MSKIIKRDGSEANFSKMNVYNAISNANNMVRIEDRFTNDEIKAMTKDIENVVKNETHSVNASDIQVMVENAIIKAGKADVAREYITYRYEKELARRKNTTDDELRTLLDGTNEEIIQENANKNPELNSTLRDYMAGIQSKDYSKRYLIPEDIYKAHKDGIGHFHDMDYFAGHLHNCDLLNIEDMLQNGTCINKVKIDKPSTFSTASNITAQIIAQVASSQYGGQTISLAHLAPFVEETRKTFREEHKKLEEKLTKEEFDAFIEEETRKDIYKGCKTLLYQINTLMTVNGQAPFVTVCMYLNEAKNEKEKEDLAIVIEETIKRRMKGVKDETGHYVGIAFPKVIYYLQEDNYKPGTKYYYLTELAAKCTADKQVPDYMSEKVMKELHNGNAFPTMGCRSTLSDVKVSKDDPWKVVTKGGVPKYYGRFNQGVFTLNLPDIALCSKKDMEKFWLLLDQRMELAHRALRLRHERLRGVKSDVAPILWQHGALARLDKHETIDKLLFNGYSTISVGYMGLHETVYYLTGKNYWEDEDTMKLAQDILNKMNEKCEQWKAVEHIGYSIYGTPAENLVGKFAKALKKRHGIVPGVSDKEFITNSYHIPVWVEMDAFTKLEYESKLQKLSKGGAISYVEMGDLRNNVDAVLSVMEYIYNNIGYAELNGSTDRCQCGFEGRIELIDNGEGKLIWKCPACGNTDKARMTIIRRVCGYLLNSNDCCQARLHDIKNRVEHI